MTIWTAPGGWTVQTAVLALTSGDSGRALRSQGATDGDQLVITRDGYIVGYAAAIDGVKEMMGEDFALLTERTGEVTMTMYRTAFGDDVGVCLGDMLYVDEGDSYGQREYSGVVTRTGGDTVTLRRENGEVITFRPDSVADLAVVEGRGT